MNIEFKCFPAMVRLSGGKRVNMPDLGAAIFRAWVAHSDREAQNCTLRVLGPLGRDSRHLGLFWRYERNGAHYENGIAIDLTADDLEAQAVRLVDLLATEVTDVIAIVKQREKLAPA